MRITTISTTPPSRNPPTVNAMYNLQVPMPIPCTTKTQFFNGQYIEDFLNQIVLHASQAGETDLDKMVKYLMDYSSNQVKDIIIYMDEFDLDKLATLKWKSAKDSCIVWLYR
ncbi:hypothetical protein BT96DRAFT_992253 [Gymnopus androsaceus JB14]|uniref:Uncharacterized protein n=1 Tax=Gymnopus androsaceus JB14 TaxID=1447944 RepID=A0A6A4HTZ6_9AGAR|nr:hypothetical protein BT96DRAFT_992253 [Gymnopus androsaceus JB14]